MFKKKQSEKNPQTTQYYNLPKVVTFGEVGILKWSIQFREGVRRNTWVNIMVQVTSPLYVYSYFTTLSNIK